VVAAFTTALGGFRPAVPLPKASGSRGPARDARLRAPATANAAADAAAEVDGHALRAMFREAREYQQNAALRAQAARLNAQLAKFRRHCDAQAQAPTQKRKQQAADRLPPPPLATTKRRKAVK
jgi:hypothetical protein